MLDGANGANKHLPDFQASPIPESVLRRRPPHKLPEDTVCRSPMAGRIISIDAVAGLKVRRNEPMVLIEAMKMQVPIGPAADGVVTTVCVAAGDTVAAGQTLFEIS